ncbi:MAG: hypothetical protein H0X29_10275 [Parachlamydiaceae bacterium]|nr:hypothetical protein [Parachlamydiaceae bacterium]
MNERIKTNKIHQYSVSISPHLHSKLEQHIFVFKKLLKPGYTKQQWLIEAIEEKLKNDDPDKEVENEKRVSFRIDALTKKILEKHVQQISYFRSSYSKRKWILDAIQEKLDLEEKAVKKKLLDHSETHSNTYAGS